MKKRVLIFCGGKSGEHEISLISAHCVLQALDRTQFEPLMLGITKTGDWIYLSPEKFTLGEIRADKIKLNPDGPPAALVPHVNEKGQASLLVNGSAILFDIAYPILHGPFGEDGTIQGLFELMEVPFVGSGSGSSWICMDKIFSKLLCSQQGIPTAPFVSLSNKERLDSKIAQIRKLKSPWFVKPNRMGSSVGISKVKQESDLEKAVAVAFQHDDRILIEQGIAGREIECAVLGLNRAARVAPPGEIVPSAKEGFYSYEGKYLMEDGAELHIPAKIEPAQAKLLQDFALNVFDSLECDGLARVDLFLENETQKIYLNEVNTLPGFTPISMYPKMWANGGIDYPSLISELLNLALQKKGLK